LLALLAWSMAIGAMLDAGLAFALAGPPVAEARIGYWVGVIYLALFGSVLCFALYFPVVRKIGPGKAAYSSVMVPIIAMTLSTMFEGYRWSPLAIGGAVLAIGGMLLALAGGANVCDCPTQPARLPSTFSSARSSATGAVPSIAATSRRRLVPDVTGRTRSESRWCSTLGCAQRRP
jgi:hypothetical protein